MKSLIKQKAITVIIDILASPISLLAAIWLKPISKLIRYLPINSKIFPKVGLLPVRDHYYQPLTNPCKYLVRSLREDRNLPEINLNINYQLALLQEFNFNHELELFPLEKKNGLECYQNSNSFRPGDGEFLYNIIRLKKPSTFIEIGSGLSTLMANSAIRKNDNGCKHICIEPYEVEWIHQLDVEVIRKKVEETDLGIFKALQKDDILFID